MNPYLKLKEQTNPKDIEDVLRVIIRERRLDIKDFDNLNNRFILGRKSARIPSGASDTLPTDKLGDVSIDYTTGYLYWLIDNAGTAVWARIPIDTSW